MASQEQGIWREGGDRPEESLKACRRWTNWPCPEEAAWPEHGVEGVCGERSENKQPRDPDFLHPSPEDPFSAVPSWGWGDKASVQTQGREFRERFQFIKRGNFLTNLAQGLER